MLFQVYVTDSPAREVCVKVLPKGTIGASIFPVPKGRGPQTKKTTDNRDIVTQNEFRTKCNCFYSMPSFYVFGHVLAPSMVNLILLGMFSGNYIQGNLNINQSYQPSKHNIQIHAPCPSVRESRTAKENVLNN